MDSLCQDNREPGENPGRSGHCDQLSLLRIPLYGKASCLMYEKVQKKGIFWRISPCICGILRNPGCKSGNLLRNVKVLPKKANITDARIIVVIIWLRRLKPASFEAGFCLCIMTITGKVIKK